MKQINVHQAKSQLSRYLQEVEAGGEVVIARAGRPVARLSPLRGRRPRRKLGLLDGRYRIPDDFDAPLPAQVLARFQGRGR